MKADQVYQAGAFSNAHGRIDDAKRKRLLFIIFCIVKHTDISFYCFDLRNRSGLLGWGTQSVFFRTEMYYTLVLQ